MSKPTQLDGLPVTRAAAPIKGPHTLPDSRRWRQPRSIRTAINGEDVGGLSLGGDINIYKDGIFQQVQTIPRDKLALRWPSGWRFVADWRPEREGILCVLENGGIIMVYSPQALMATAEEK